MNLYDSAFTRQWKRLALFTNRNTVSVRRGSEHWRRIIWRIAWRAAE